MNRYFSIGEVSKIKGVGIKSLRYYDRIGVLKPAYVNPDTGYRYYAMQQIFELDIISFCIELGIPLKEYKEYFDTPEQIMVEKLLKDSRRIAQEKLRSITLGLRKVEKMLNNIRCAQTYTDKGKNYTRRIEERNILMLPFEKSYDSDDYILKLSELFTRAKSIGTDSAFQSGILYEMDGDDVNQYIFTEVLEWVESDIVKTIPSGEYLCRRDNKSRIDECRELFGDRFPKGKRVTVLDCDLFESTIRHDQYSVEMQVRVGT